MRSESLVDKVLPQKVLAKDEKTRFIRHEEKYSGVSSQVKLDKVSDLMEKQDVDSLFVSMLEEVSWLLNTKMTGQHEFDPLFNASLLYNKRENKVTLFV